jgi:hypothetical protein
MKFAFWRAVGGLALAGALVVTPPSIGYAVEALRTEPGATSIDSATDLRMNDNDDDWEANDNEWESNDNSWEVNDDNDNDWESNQDNDNADEAAAPVAPQGVDPNPSNNDPNNNGDQSGGGGDSSGSQP